MTIHDLVLPPVLAIHLLAIETLAGSLFFSHAVVGPAGVGLDGPAAADFEAKLGRLAQACLAVAAITMLVWLGVVAAKMSGAETLFVTDGPILATVLRQTEFGLVWLGRFALCILLSLLIRLMPARRGLAEDNLPWAGLLLLTFALVSHAAAGGGGHHSLLLTVMVLHLGATAAWIGSLLPLAWLLAGAGRDDRSITLARRVVDRYSLYGGAAVATLVAAGAVLAATLLSGGRAPLDSAFAHVLWGKLALFALMGGMALANRLWLAPRLRHATQPQTVLALMWRVVLAEYMVGSFILLAAAILAQTQPPMG